MLLVGIDELCELLIAGIFGDHLYSSDSNGLLQDCEIFMLHG